MSAELILLVGTFASGKSTYIQENIRENVLVVNDDAIVNSLHGGINTLYREKNKPLYKSIENSIIIYGLTHGYKVIVDRPNLKVSTRRRYIGLADSFDAPCSAIVFPTPSVEEAVRRRMNHDSRGYTASHWLRVFKEMEDVYEIPRPNEGLSKIVEFTG